MNHSTLNDSNWLTITSQSSSIPKDMLPSDSTTTHIAAFLRNSTSSSASCSTSSRSSCPIFDGNRFIQVSKTCGDVGDEDDDEYNDEIIRLVHWTQGIDSSRSFLNDDEVHHIPLPPTIQRIHGTHVMDSIFKDVARMQRDDILLEAQQKIKHYRE